MIFFFFYLSINFSFEKYIKLTFHSNNLNSKNDFPENYIHNDIYIDIPFGTPEQIIPLNIRLQSYLTFITSEDFKEGNIKKFSYNSSLTFLKLMKSKYRFAGREYTEGIKVSDTIKLGNLKIENFQFVLMNNISYLQSGILGLSLKENHDSMKETSLIFQLKKQNFISSYAFSLKYLNNENGELIIGEYPHNYNKNFLENNFVYMKSGVKGSLINWLIDFDDIYYNNLRIKGNKKVLLKIEFGFIIGTKEFFDVIQNEYFNKNNNCKLNTYDNIYKYYICDKHIDIKKFQLVSFGLKDIKYSFNFTGNDLFFELNDKKYFLIFFRVNNTNDDDWVFGKPFFQKNFLVFDSDRKIIGMYLKNNNNINNSINTILVYFFGIIIIILILYIFLYLRKKKMFRSKRLNELELLLE